MAVSFPTALYISSHMHNIGEIKLVMNKISLKIDLVKFMFVVFCKIHLFTSL